VKTKKRENKPHMPKSKNRRKNQSGKAFLLRRFHHGVQIKVTKSVHEAAAPEHRKKGSDGGKRCIGRAWCWEWDTGSGPGELQGGNERGKKARTQPQKKITFETGPDRRGKKKKKKDTLFD